MLTKNQKRNRINHPSWSVWPLEQRLMLAADAGAAVGAVADCDTVPVASSPATSVSAQSTAKHLVFVDPNVPEMAQIVDGVHQGSELVLLQADQDGIDQISRVIATHRDVASIHIIAHGQSGQVQIGNSIVTEATLVQCQDRLRGWRNALAADADILIYGCHTGSGVSGLQFMQRLASLTGADVAASDDATGASAQGGDWILEQSVGKIESGLALSAQMRKQYAGVLPISILAAGVTNDEQMQLQIDSATVATFNNVGGDAYGGQFQTYTYDADGIRPDQVRVVFTNDLFDQAVGVDRNLRIDSIALDGVTYQAEDPSVFSTGTWLPGDGVTDGFGRGEFLHADGYLQFGATGGTLITIEARGATGQESMSLQIDGETVASWDDVSSNSSAYTFVADEGVTPDQVRVAFTNDLFDEANGIDRNLIVDFVVVDGQTIQTESSQVFSNGTWVSGQGVTPGFGRGDTLHTDGYFQYAGGQTSGSTINVAVQGFEGDELVELLIDGQSVQQWTDIGTSSQILSFNASDVVSADQVRVAFTNDLFNASTDRNVRVDRIEIDGNTYQTEDYYVFSTGAWTSEDGIVDGYGRGDVLNTDGYFQYASNPPVDDGDFGLASSVVNIDEADGVATLTINRTGGSSTPAAIEYRTVSITAQDGPDFDGVDDVLVFQPGETSRDIVVPIVVDAIGEGSETFSFTIDNPAGAGLLVPRTATITINDIALPNYTSFSSTAGLDLNGAAQQSGSRLRLTTTNQDTAGSVFYDSALPIDTQTSIQSQFAFNINGGDGGGGADGLTFVIQGNSADASALGASGGALGYEGITNSLAIEFDTYQNGGDVNANHVSVLVNGSTTTPIATKTYAVDLNNGATKYAWVEYNGTNNLLAVYLSESNSKPSNPLITTTIDLQTLVGGEAYVGFTSGVGGLQNNHDILNWTLNTDVPSIPDPPNPGGTLVAQSVATGLVKPTSMDFTADGTNMYIAEQRGIIHVYQNGVDQGTLLDFTDRVNGTRDRGLLDIAVHPDLANSPYLYLLYTYDPPQVSGQAAGSLAGADGNGNRAGRMTRVTLDASTGYTSVIADSEVVLIGGNSTWDNFNAFANSTSNFNEPPAGILEDGSNLQDFIATDSESHTVGSIEFGPDGALYVSIGDGTSYNQVDVRTLRVQDIDNLSGKILRVDPITGEGLSDNPFYNGDADANRSKVYQYGVRNPFRITVDDATGQVYVGDVGWTRWEEINAGEPGANFGWPFYEGASGSNSPTNNYQNLPEAVDFYANADVTPSILALNHAADGINAIVLGDIYTGNQYPAEYQGDLFFNDLGQGIVRNISFDANGDVAGVQTFTTGAQIVVQMVQGPDGFMYFVDLNDGLVGRWEFV
ncbi:carbohydrate-binding domain-containing protein [Planctomycetes bacterium K23_9]|uniref:Soluble aldose sugar dehydrogenase YliI n=1 Tax=Stieleria marina TaxID=1930275 RepID=A0A517P1G1_9BACT|nr:Soluble aldose sugar dehydrogenase YliI precursor [Planctomycetes bacterium K23_9]